MKKLALFILAITIGTATVFANPIEKKDTKILRDEIVKLLENVPFEVPQEINASVVFIVTPNGEIIVTDN